MPFDRPTATELVQVTQEFLSKDLLNTSSTDNTGAIQFRTRIAANILSIVERELQFGAPLLQEETKRLETLLDQQGPLKELNQHLAIAIRERHINYNDPALLDHLKHTTMGKMKVDNPKYSTYVIRQQETTI